MTAKRVGNPICLEVELFPRDPNKKVGLAIDTTPPKLSNVASTSNLLTDSLRKIRPRGAVYTGAV